MLRRTIFRLRRDFMNKSFHVLLTLILITAAGAAAAALPQCGAYDGNRGIAEAFAARWQAALNSGDEAALSALYADGAVLMPPADETLVGRRPVTQYLMSGDVPARDTGYQVDLVSCDFDGDRLHIAGVWGTPGSPRADAGTWTSGNLLRVLEQTASGDWVSTYEIWN
jgi:ketosteroid isomerase-like protein